MSKGVPPGRGVPPKYTLIEIQLESPKIVSDRNLNWKIFDYK